MKLAFNSFGQKNQKEILILHGIFGSKRNWYSIAKAIAQNGNKVWVLDLRNHGESDWSESHTYFDIAEDIKIFVRENKIKEFCLLGHSMGGKAAMLFDLLNPNVVSEHVELASVSSVEAFFPLFSFFVFFFSTVKSY